MTRSAGWIPVVLGALALGCAEPPEPYDPLPLPLTAPRLIDDSKLPVFLNQLPVDEYEVHEVDGIGRFLIDDGDDLIKHSIVEGEAWEEHVIEVLERHVVPGTVALDVGAHIGTHTLVMARLIGPRGRVYAFEPQRKIYRELFHNLRLNGANNVEPLRFALGAGAPRIIHMNPTVEGNEGGTGVGQGGDRAEMRSLDSFRFREVSLIKIDVEGFEDQVLDGAARTLRRERPVVVIEIQGGSRYETATPEIRARIDDTRAKLERLGYRVTGLRNHDYLALPAESPRSGDRADGGGGS